MTFRTLDGGYLFLPDDIIIIIKCKGLRTEVSDYFLEVEGFLEGRVCVFIMTLRGPTQSVPDLLIRLTSLPKGRERRKNERK